MNALFARFPRLAGRLPWLELVRAPTPVAELPGLGWVKRDDLTGEIYGGNKVRKLEFLLGDARHRGHRSILTIGASGSNHVLASAIYAKQQGFIATHAVLFPQPHSDDVARKQRAYRELGVRAAHVPGKLLVPFGAAARALASLARGEGRPYLIAPGGSSPIGALGYVAAALELAEQVEAKLLPAPEAIYVPLGSGGTVAGLLVGLRLAGLPARVVAVQVVPSPWVSARGVVKLAERTRALLARHGVETGGLADLELDGGQLGSGYGVTTPAADAAVARAAAAGLRLDTTYSGKALAALLASGRRERALFWNTYFLALCSASPLLR